MGTKQASLFGGYIETKRKSVKPKPKKIRTEELKSKIQSLYNMYEELYKRQGIDIIEARDYIIKGNVAIYPEERQAEPISIVNLTIRDIDKRLEEMEKALQK